MKNLTSSPEVTSYRKHAISSLRMLLFVYKKRHIVNKPFPVWESHLRPEAALYRRFIVSTLTISLFDRKWRHIGNTSLAVWQNLLFERKCRIWPQPWYFRWEIKFSNREWRFSVWRQFRSKNELFIPEAAGNSVMIFPQPNNFSAKLLFGSDDTLYCHPAFQPVK